MATPAPDQGKTKCAPNVKPEIIDLTPGEEMHISNCISKQISDIVPKNCAEAPAQDAGMTQQPEVHVGLSGSEQSLAPIAVTGDH